MPDWADQRTAAPLDVASEVARMELRDGVWPSDYPDGYWERGEGSNYVSYGDDPGWGQTLVAMWPWLPKDRPLLEVGCAKGYFVKACLEIGLDAWGIDLSEYAIEHAAPGTRARLTHGSATMLPWEADSFGTVVSWEMLEHVPGERLSQVLHQMHGVLQTGGLMVHRIGTLEAGTDLSDHLHDRTHVTNQPGMWWRDRIGRVMPDADPLPGLEDALDAQFRGRDWSGRFFAYGVG